jgi:hypothetical protein
VTVRGALWAVATDPVVWLVALVGTLLNPLDEPLLAFLVAHLEDARGVTAAGATLVATLSVVGAFGGYVTLRRRRAALAVDAALLAVATTAVVVAPTAWTAGIAAFLVGVFLVRVWIDVQARQLLVRPGQAGSVKAMVTVVETVGLCLPVVAGVIADHLGVTAGLATFAGLAWALSLAAAVLVRQTGAGRGRRPGRRRPAGRSPDRPGTLDRV